jgi:hypothetical protein
VRVSLHNKKTSVPTPRHGLSVRGAHLVSMKACFDVLPISGNIMQKEPLKQLTLLLKKEVAKLIANPDLSSFSSTTL